MKGYRNEEALVLTPESEQDRALLNILAAATCQPDSAITPPPPNSAQTTPRSASASPVLGS